MSCTDRDEVQLELLWRGGSWEVENTEGREYDNLIELELNDG